MNHVKQIFLIEDEYVPKDSIKHLMDESAYELQVSQGIITHATINLNADELEDIYGIRLRSRLWSMFNLVLFLEWTKDKRK